MKTIKETFENLLEQEVYNKGEITVLKMGSFEEAKKFSKRTNWSFGTADGKHMWDTYQEGGYRFYGIVDKNGNNKNKKYMVQVDKSGIDKIFDSKDYEVPESMLKEKGISVDIFK